MTVLWREIDGVDGVFSAYGVTRLHWTFTLQVPGTLGVPKQLVWLRKSANPIIRSVVSLANANKCLADMPTARPGQASFQLHHPWSMHHHSLFTAQTGSSLPGLSNLAIQEVLSRTVVLELIQLTFTRRQRLYSRIPSKPLSCLRN